MLKRSFFFLFVFALIGTGGYFVWGRLQETVKVDPPQLVAVNRGLFTHEILERGSVDSAQNTEIRCRVENAGQGGLTITYVVDEGTIVEEGDILVELDSSTLTERIGHQRITVLNSTSKLERSKADLRTAELNLQEYLEGTYIKNRKTMQNQIFSAEEAVKTHEDNLSYYQRLYERGYVTESKIAADLLELDKAKNAQEIAELDLRILDTLTKEKMVNQFQAAIASNQTTVMADTEILELDTKRLEHLEEQERRCTIRAPRGGQVVYYVPRWGSNDDNLIRLNQRVYDRQILLLLPDPTQMQVKGLVNEANVRLVRPGQKASVRLEAFPNEVFDGVVRTVRDYPEPTSFMGGTMSKEYETLVTILNPPEGVKTGLTAEARIVVNEIPDALLLPMQAVFEYGGKMYAVTFKDGKWDKIEVKTGPANDKEVVILEGLKEGDEVVLGAWAHRDKIYLPKLETKPELDEDIDPELLLEQMRQEELRQRSSEGGAPRGDGEGQQRASAGERQPRERPASAGTTGGTPPANAAPGGNRPSGPPPGGGGGGGGGPRP
jgi:multidrug efflux pump subunit AcrA (membrane-fusion protein)